MVDIIPLCSTLDRKSTVGSAAMILAITDIKLYDQPRRDARIQLAGYSRVQLGAVRGSLLIAANLITHCVHCSIHRPAWEFDSVLQF